MKALAWIENALAWVGYAIFLIVKWGLITALGVYFVLMVAAGLGLTD